MRNYILIFLFFILATACPPAISQPDKRKKASSAAEIFHSITHLQSIKSPNIYSPKSVIFSRDGKNFMVNSLEGMKTVIFDAQTLAEQGVIEHKFREADAPLFQDEDRIFDYDYYILPKNGLTNCFEGKPVEFALSHEGKYLWVSYYRRNFDAKATSPSAIAVIDTEIMRPVRIMPAGAIPKMLVPSPDGKTMAVINWGDNTIALIDISSSDASDFYYVKQFADGKKLDLAGIGGDRDSNCGYCLRGAAFSPDSRNLFVGRMRGGISVFDVGSGEKIGQINGLPPTPRHLVADGSRLFVSSNSSGYVSEVDIDQAIADLRASPTGTITVNPKKIFVGNGARTIALSPGGKYIFAVSNNPSHLSMIDRDKWQVICQAPVSPYAVGLAVSPDGKTIVTTSQGRKGHGGHVIDVFRLR